MRQNKCKTVEQYLEIRRKRTFKINIFICNFFKYSLLGKQNIFSFDKKTLYKEYN